MSNSINSSSNSTAANSSNASNAPASSNAARTSGSNAATGSDQSADADSGQPDGFILQQGKLFRTLMTAPEGDAESEEEVSLRGGLLPGRQEEDDDGGSDYAGLGNGLHRGDVDIAAQLLAQRLLEAGTQLQGTPAAAPAPDPTFAELMVKHIRRALVSADAADDSGGEIRLEMSDTVLPSTVLSLRRTEEGWQLNAVTSNAESRETLTRFAPTLVERFAQSSLGQLRISLDGAQG